MSDTPETDHLETHLGCAAIHSHPILWEHNRKLERERDEARINAQKSKAYKRVLKITNENLKRERDEAREELQTELEMWRDENIMHEIHRNELEKVERERDEAREEVRLLKAILDLIKKDVS